MKEQESSRFKIVLVLAVLFLLGGAGFVLSQYMFADNGAVVLLKADNSPFKTKPDDPGGVQIPNQDKMVFNAVSPEGKQVTVERIMPPPEQPMVAQPAPIVPAPNAPVAMGRAVEAPSVTTVSNAAQPIQLAAVPVAPAAFPIKDEAVKAPTAIVSTPEKAPEAKDVKKPEDKKAVTEEKMPDDAAEKTTEPTVTKANFQLASFNDRPSAEKAAGQMQKKYGTPLFVTQGEVKGRKVFRVQGRADDAGALCARIKAQGGSCVTLRP